MTCPPCRYLPPDDRRSVAGFFLRATAGSIPNLMPLPVAEISPGHKLRWRSFAVVYTLLIVYGSLLPFYFHSMTFAAAWAGFQEIQYLKIGSEHRADWMANLILFIPMAYLWAAALPGERSQSRRLVSAATAFLLCLGVAFAIEFAQVFTYRTVSQNDLIAEFLGSVIGVLLWLFAGRRLRSIYHQAISNSEFSLQAALVLYALAYCTMCMMPLDFVLSSDELAAKIDRGDVSWWLAVAEPSKLRLGGKLGLEILVSVPIGLLAALWAGGKNPRSAMLSAVFVGLAFGLVMEGLQLLMLSGRSQGISVLTRTVGATFGGGLPSLFGYWRLESARPWLKVAAISAAPFYIVGAASVRGWSTVLPFSWNEFREAIVNENINYLPFYYHYWSAEAVALYSVVMNAALYAPIGIMLRILVGDFRWLNRLGIPLALLCGAAFAAIMELGRLSAGPLKADVTNVLIAAVSAAIGYGLCGESERWIRQFGQKLRGQNRNNPTTATARSGT